MGTLYLFTDGHPFDWLEAGQDDRWHTVVYVAVSSLPEFDAMTDALRRMLPRGNLRRWKGGDAYRQRFKAAFRRVWPEFKPWINGISFQERTIRQGRAQVLQMFNQYTALGRSISLAVGGMDIPYCVMSSSMPEAIEE